MGHPWTKLGHTAQILINLVNTLEVTFFTQLSSDLVRMLVQDIVWMRLMDQGSDLGTLV
jgi:hypothetical protein